MRLRPDPSLLGTLCSTALICSLAAAAVGCKSSPSEDGAEASAKGKAAPAGPGPAQAQPAETDEAADVEAAAGTTPPRLDEAMKRHFAEVSTIKQAVIDGDLESVAEPARWLSKELPVEGMPTAWRPHLTRMQSAAQDAQRADDLLGAGEAAGRLVATCGACHAAVENGPKFGIASEVPEGDSTTARMQRHQWAADRMWEGMVGRDEARWRAGAAAVSEKPPVPCPIPDEHVLPTEALQLRDKIHEVGARAAEASDWDARAQVYGEYLTTCAGCHVGGC